MKHANFISLALLAGMLTACGEAAAPLQETTAAPDTTVPETTALTSANYLDSYDFGGAEYHILGRQYAKLGTLPSIEFDVDEENGDLINDTIYRRNRKIEEQYNVVITAENCPQSDAAGLVERSQMAGDGAYDLVWAHINVMTGLCLKGLLSDYHDLPVIDIEQPWWNQLATESLTINGRCYLQMNYIPFTGMMLSHCLFFNKAMAEDNNIGDIYSMVEDGSWTFDAFAALSKKVSRDVDGNGTYDANDIYGLVCSHGTSGGAFAVGMRQHTPILVEPSGSFKLNMVSDNIQLALEKLVDLTSDISTYMITDYSMENDLAIMFSEGKALFYSGFMTDAYQFFRSMKDDFGLLPFPKFDEAQDGYTTTVTGGTGLLGIPKVLKNEEMVGVVTEALAIESLNDVYPAIYETVFNNKLLRDEESQSMFGYLMSGMEIDFGRTYKYSNYSDVLQALVAQGSTSLASTAESYAAAAEEHYASVIKLFFDEK